MLLFFFNDTATTEIYTLSLHDALPICRREGGRRPRQGPQGGHRPAGEGDRPPGGQGLATLDRPGLGRPRLLAQRRAGRSEEHTSELQSRQYLVCRLLLEKKKKPLLITQ